VRPVGRLTVIAFGEEVRHYLDVAVASVIQARQVQAGFDGLEQGEVRVELTALHAALTVVGVHDEDDVVGIGSDAVIVFIPDDDDGVASLFPGWRIVDGLYQVAKGEVALVDEGRVQAVLRAVADGVIVAGRSGIAAAVLVIALIGSDEGVLRHAACVQVFKQAVRALEADHVAQAVAGIDAFLNATEVDEGIVLGGVLLDNALGFLRHDGCRVQFVGIEAVAVIDEVSSGWREVFLIAFPVAAKIGKLVADCLA
jgi:hypothetical protein